MLRFQLLLHAIATIHVRRYKNLEFFNIYHKYSYN